MQHGQKCSAWVVTLMPLFTAGCEVDKDEDKRFVLEQLHMLESCLGSFNFRTARQALEGLWATRLKRNDCEGVLWAGQTLGKPQLFRLNPLVYLSAFLFTKRCVSWADFKRLQKNWALPLFRFDSENVRYSFLLPSK
jgi:hypothetical protein